VNRHAILRPDGGYPDVQTRNAVARRGLEYRAIDRKERDMKPPILVDFPERFETQRLFVRSPLPGDGPEVHAAVRESIGELSPWMGWPKEHRTVDDSEASARRARVAFQARSELRLHLYLREQTRSWASPACRT